MGDLIHVSKRSIRRKTVTWEKIGQSECSGRALIELRKLRDRSEGKAQGKFDLAPTVGQNAIDLSNAPVLQVCI